MRWKTARWSAALVLLCVSSLANTASTYRFTLDPGSSSVDARVAFLGIGSRKAYFPALRGNVVLSPDQMTHIILDVSIDATQLKADDTVTTGRLKGKDFFYVDKYPTVRFAGTQLAMADATSGVVTGELTARGVTRPVTLNVKFSAPPATASGKEAIRLTGMTTINRREFGMTAYSVVVGKKVSITIRTRLLPD
ncbi:YceI family protein [Sphingorhabdus sp.]|uniref:YceI family protein n=1 Tax=Sphingorhabdus sp. TaxID=1902408 RepID=UPI0035B04603|nr:YceI family protein [Sphingomonadaceae bacterium]